MAYQIDFRPSALRSFKKLSKDAQRRITEELQVLSTQPYPPGVQKLVNEENVYRVRTGDYRIIYQLEGKKLLILVLRIGHRKDVYR